MRSVVSFLLLSAIACADESSASGARITAAATYYEAIDAQDEADNATSYSNQQASDRFWDATEAPNVGGNDFLILTACKDDISDDWENIESRYSSVSMGLWYGNNLKSTGDSYFADRQFDTAENYYNMAAASYASAKENCQSISASKHDTVVKYLIIDWYARGKPQE